MQAFLFSISPVLILGDQATQIRTSYLRCDKKDPHEFTKSEIEKKMKKTHMNEENLKESSARKRLPIKR